MHIRTSRFNSADTTLLIRPLGIPLNLNSSARNKEQKEQTMHKVCQTESCAQPVLSSSSWHIWPLAWSMHETWSARSTVTAYSSAKTKSDNQVCQCLPHLLALWDVVKQQIHRSRRFGSKPATSLPMVSFLGGLIDIYNFTTITTCIHTWERITVQSSYFANVPPIPVILEPIKLPPNYISWCMLQVEVFNYI